MRQQHEVAHVGVERLLQHPGRLGARGDHDHRRAGLLADRRDLHGGEVPTRRRVEHAVQVPAGENPAAPGDLLALADEIDVLLLAERLAQSLESVAVSGAVDADCLGHRMPPPRSVVIVSTWSGLFVALPTGLSESVQSAFFITNKSFSAWVSLTARITDSCVFGVT